MKSEEYKIRNMLILEEDRHKSIKIDDEQFVIKAIFPKDRKAIARELALQFNGLPQNSYSADDRYFFEKCVTVDTLIVESPEWWSNAEDCADYDFVEKLYDEVIKWNNEFQEKLKKNKFGKRGSKASVSS